MKKKIAIAASVLLLSACAQKANIAPPQTQLSSALDVTDIYGKNEIFIIYAKDGDGRPRFLEETSQSQADVISYFKKDEGKIDAFDCIRVSRVKVNNQSVSVCEEAMWFDYGLEGKTLLTTRKAKDVENTAAGVLGLVVTPLTAAMDVLSFDPSFSKTRQGITKRMSDPEQDFDFLNQVRANINVIAMDTLREKKKTAHQSLGTTKALLSTYSFTAVDAAERDGLIRTNIDREFRSGSPSGIYQVIIDLSVSGPMRDYGTQRLRDLRSFEGYARAFDLTNDVADAKQAQQFASSSGDLRKTEYMAIKLVKAKLGGSLTKLFAVRQESPSRSSVSAQRGWGFFLDNSNSGQANFSTRVNVAADKSVGVFEHGIYDVKIRTTVTVWQHFYRRSAWVGNADEQRTQNFTAEKTVRLSPPNYSATADTSVNNVLLNYKDRGIMGGTTEITMIGDPEMKSEVVDVELVE